VGYSICQIPDVCLLICLIVSNIVIIFCRLKFGGHALHSVSNHLKLSAVMASMVSITFVYDLSFMLASMILTVYTCH
jgi:hypothetical protein